MKGMVITIMSIAKIRLMVIDDSLFFRTFLTRNVEKDPIIEIIGSYGDPLEASKHIHVLQPDVIALDMEMPRIRGDEFLRTIMPKHPTVKTIVISALSSNVFDAMHAGAIDFVGKPGSTPGFDEKAFIAEVIQKIKIASTARTRRFADQVATIAPKSPAKPDVSATTRYAATRSFALGATSKSVIAIGASTGGTEAIIEVIKHFPANTPAVVIVQHMPPVFTKMYAERVDKICMMNVREAKSGDRVNTGTILLAPGGNEQMSLRQDSKGYYVSLSPGVKVSGHCPSVDVLFESVSKVAGKNAVGVLLTGMGADGAKGLLSMKQRGAYTIGQDEESCVVYGMPMEAHKLGAVSTQVPLSDIGGVILRRFRQ